MKRKVEDLRIGDMVDFEADVFADPNYDEEGGSDHPEFAFEYAVIGEIEIEGEVPWLSLQRIFRNPDSTTRRATTSGM